MSPVGKIVSPAVKTMSPVVRTMTRLGMIRITLLMTAASAIMSVAVAWLLSQVIAISNMSEHLWLAFVIPFFVTPGFSWLTAISMRESRMARKMAYELARRDPLTGVFNRRAFFDADQKARDASAKNTASRAILFLDIDHFKMVNDTWGHEGGDAVLVHLAGLLQNCTRKSDLISRFGGEEFVVEAIDCETEGAISLAERILSEIRAAHVSFGACTISYTVSIGIAAGDKSLPTDRLLACADAQLYIAKQNGRNDWRCDPAPGHAAPASAAASTPASRRLIEQAA